MRKVLTMAMLASAVLVSACNTIAGAGKDVSSAGQTVTGAANDVKD
ncbi:entericidin EcnAB [Sphingomonas sp. Leaf412]|nr:entericidin A/B family lipoprotein [Sphingomonas sp. Leaf412]KQT31199.1 entericidin EcnAB [Sphingomonas sp. Leaf412]